MEDGKRYLAFISYQRQDEAWAKRLHHNLEHYRIPTTVRKNRKNLPKEIRPIFRDTLELSSGVLAREIATALAQSKHLIVICSPQAAQSHWVDKEIQTFIEQGHEEKIIPFIIDGTPNSSNNETECFPPALRSLRNDKELLGININEFGREAATVKVVARMFDLNFDTLWQRFKREQSKKRHLFIGGSIIFAAISLFVGTYFMRQNNVIENQRDQLKNVTIQLRNDSIALSNHITRIQNDSITLSLQKDSISRTNNRLHELNNSLQLSNKNLQEANIKIKKQNYDLKESNYTILSGRATELLDQGNLIEAQKIIKQICNDEDIDRIMYQPKIEYALRRTYRYQHQFKATKRIQSRFILDNLGYISFAQLSSDGNELYAVLNNNTFVKFNTLTGEELQRIYDITPLSHGVQFYKFDEGTQSIIYTIDNNVFFKNILTKEDILSPITAREEINELIISNDLKHLVYCIFSAEYRTNDDEIEPVFNDEWHLVNLSTNKAEDNIIPNCNDVFAFSPDGNSIFVENDTDYYLYDVNNHCILNQIPYNGHIAKAHFTKDGNNIVILNSSITDYPNDHIDVWNIPSNGLVQFGARINSFKNIITKVQETPKSNIIVTGGFGVIKLYDTELLRYYSIVKEVNKQLGFGRVISGQIIDSISEPDEGIFTLQFNYSGSTLLTSSDHRIHIWDVDTADLVDNYNNPLQKVFMAPSGKHYLSWSKDELLILHDTKTNEPIGNPLYKRPDFDPDNPYQNPPFLKPTSISRNGEIVVLENRTDSLLFIVNLIQNDYFLIKYHCNQNHLRLSIDQTGRYVAVSDDNFLNIFDSHKKELIISSDTIKINYLELSPDGNEVALCLEDKLSLYMTRTLKEKYQLNGYSGDIYKLTYSPDGNLLAGVTSDWQICIWAAKEGKLIQIIKSPKARLEYCSISPDNNYILAMDIESHVYIWNLNSNKLVDDFQSSSYRNKFYFCQDVPYMLYYYNDFGYHFMDFPPLQTIINKYK